MSSRLALVALAVLTSACAHLFSHKPPENPNLHHVKRVFVPQQIDPDEKALAQLPIAEREPIDRASSVPTRLANFLAEALANRGFVIVRSEAESNATITLESLEPIVVDGPLPNQQFGFAATVRSPSLGVNWRTVVSSLVNETHPVAERRNMETIAERLFKAWKESAVRAGDLTPVQAKGLKRIG